MKPQVALYVYDALKKFESLPEPKEHNVISVLLPGNRLYSILKLPRVPGYTEEWFNTETNETSRKKFLGNSIGAAISSKVINDSPKNLAVFADGKEVLFFEFRY